MPTMLVIDDDAACRRTLELHFSERGFDVATAGDGDAGLASLERREYGVVILDIRMPGRDGLSLLEEIGERFPEIPVVMITAFQDLENTVAAFQCGAVDFVGKPIDLSELDAAIDRALEVSEPSERDCLIVGTGSAKRTIVGRTRVMQDVFKAIGKVTQSRVTVLITGDSGTGKELIARAIHSASEDRDKPLVAINCSALVETLLESELFGHERGAFTGAVTARKGKAELAGEGVLFLDEVSSLSMRMQGKLLRLLEEREFTPVGGAAVKRCNARFIAATNVDLATLVERGEFREDLFYRLHVFEIRSPALRDRSGDIPLLVQHLLRRISGELGQSVRQVTAEALDALSAHDWPGNVRQLGNVLTQAVVMARSDTLTLADLPKEFVREPPLLAAGSGRPPVKGFASDPLSLKELERRHIIEVLTRTGWHKGRACEILGISRPRLDRRIKEYGLVHTGSDAREDTG